MAVADPERPLDGLGLEADERHVLDVGAVGVAGLQAELAELLGQIGDRLLLARRARPAALELVGRQDLDVPEQVGGRDALHRLVLGEDRARQAHRSNPTARHPREPKPLIPHRYLGEGTTAVVRGGS